MGLTLTLKGGGAAMCLTSSPGRLKGITQNENKLVVADLIRQRGEEMEGKSFYIKEKYSFGGGTGLY